MKKTNSLRYVTYAQIIFFFLFIVLLVLFAGNTSNPDYFEYSTRYEAAMKSSNTGYLLYLVGLIFKKIGFSFQMFRFFEALAGLLLLSKTIKRYSDKPGFTLICYFIYPFLLDVVQVGNFLAYTIALYCFRYLEEKSLKNGIKYTVGIVIASQFHILSIIYLIFLLSYIKKTKMLVWISAFITVVLTVGIRFLPNLIPYIPLINSRSSQIKYYLTYQDSYRNGAISYLIILLAIFIVFLVKTYLLKQRGEELFNETHLSFVRIFSLVFCFVPFVIINAEFVRLIRNIWILYFCIFTKKYWVKNQKIFLYAALLIACFLFYKELAPGSYYFESVTKAIFGNNIFW